MGVAVRAARRQRRFIEVIERIRDNAITVGNWWDKEVVTKEEVHLTPTEDVRDVQTARAAIMLAVAQKATEKILQVSRGALEAEENSLGDPGQVADLVVWTVKRQVWSEMARK